MDYTKNIVALAIGIILSFILLEIVLNFHNPFPIQKKGDKVVLISNVNRVYKLNGKGKLESQVINTTNSLGFRGPELQNKNDYKIIIAGGSVAACVFTSDSLTWPFLLYQKLKKNRNDIWLNNASIGGHSALGVIAMLKHHIVPLKPDMVLFSLGWNDILYKDNWGYGNWIEKEQKSLVTDLVKSSELIATVAYTVRTYFGIEKTISQGKVWDFEKMNTYIADNHLISNELETIEIEKSVLKFEQKLKKIIDICLDNNITPVLMTHSTVVGNAIDPTTGINLGQLPPKWINKDGMSSLMDYHLLQKHNDKIREIAKNENIHLVELENKLNKDTKYYYDYIHYSNDGEQAVADIIFTSLKAFFAK